MPPRSHPTIRQQLTAVLAASPIPLRAISRATAIDVSTLSKAVAHRRALSGDAVDRLADFFGLALTAPPTPTPTPAPAGTKAQPPNPTKPQPKYRTLNALAKALANTQATKPRSTRQPHQQNRRPKSTTNKV